MVFCPVLIHSKASLLTIIKRTNEGVSSGKDGIEVIVISEVRKEKYEEALNLESRRVVLLFGIEGYRYEIKTLLTLEEAMPLLGLKMPAV
jgi:hypothetical protein